MASDCHTRGAARVRWTPRPDGLEESVQFQPGYNCPVRTMQGHGVHGMEIFWLLRGPAGAIQIMLGTDWIPGELHPGHGMSPDGTRGWQRHDGLWSGDPNGRGIGVHALSPQHEGHEAETTCGLLDGRLCYYDESLSGADYLVPLFMADGEQPVWDALEARYAKL